MNRNWQGWAALVLAGLALIVAISGRGMDRMAWAQMQAPVAPQAPQFERSDEFSRMHERFGPGIMDRERGFAMDEERFERRFGPGMMGHDRHGHGFFWGLFGLLGALTKLAALGALAWLLFRLFRQRNGTPPAAPTTPAGHDPRVE
ncbi:MAG: hypothetical protein HC822_08850 [Oscillochloris sp.]|nr:hypothetical protein [Oscillochloris sp.]